MPRKSPEQKELERIAKDNEIILANPDLTPVELYKKGLSSKEYSRLLRGGIKKVTIPEPNRHKITPYIEPKDVDMTPKLIKADDVVTYSGDQVRVQTESGRIQEFSISEANRLVRKYPELYKIVK